MTWSSRHVARLAGACVLGGVVATASAWQVREEAGSVIGGTASIAGLVESADGASTPIRRAVVTVSGSPLDRPRSAITGDDGRFLVEHLPAGRFTVTARKPAHLDQAYGARAPGRPGTMVSTTDGGRVEIRLPLTRGGVIAGGISGEDGEPLPGVSVRALAIPITDGSRIHGETEQVTTDDRGLYRLYGLPPGTYLVVASLPAIGSGVIGRASVNENDDALARLASRGRMTRPGAPAAPAAALDPVVRAVSLAPIFYPGTPLVDAAQPLTLAVAEERTGVSFTVAPMPAMTIAGVIGDSAAPGIDGLELTIRREGFPRSVANGIGAGNPVLTTLPAEAGRFEYSSVSPGRYVIMARRRHRALGVGNELDADPDPAGRGSGSPPARPGLNTLGPGETFGFARAEVTVTSADLTGLVLDLRPGATLSGRVVFEGVDDPPVVLEDVVVRLRPFGGFYTSSSNNTIVGNRFSQAAPAHVSADGTFAFPGLAPDRYEFAPSLPQGSPVEWWPLSAETDGRDLLDAPFEIGDTDVSNVVVTYTDRRSELGGRLETADGAGTAGYFIVVVPADRTRWVAGSRRMQAVRPDTAGVYSVTKLPPGDYLLAALTDFEPADLEDSAFLDTLASVALPVTIRDGSRTVQDLRVAGAR